MTCLFFRRRLGAYVDGALEGARAQRAARHLAGCAACRREADGLRRMRTMLQRALSPAGRPAEPDWTGFWPGVVRGIEAGARQPRVETARQVWLRPRWALGGALVAAFLASVTFWQAQAPPALADPVVVSAADTEHPQGSVMIYHTADRGVTVVWVFGVDDDEED